MTQTQEQYPPLRSIFNTLNLYDPNGRTVLVGSAAIHLDFARRSGDIELLGLKDVDALTTQAELEAIQRDLNPTDIESATLKDRRLMVMPSESARRLGVVAFDAISDSDSYDDPLVKTKLEERIYAWSGILKDQITEHAGIRYVKLPIILWWKMAIGRPSDIEAVIRVMNELDRQQLFESGEPRKLLEAIDVGNMGDDPYPWPHRRRINSVVS